MDITFRQKWRDPRLKFAAHKTVLDLNKIVLTGEESTNYPIWVPDTFFRNGRRTHIHQQTVPNEYTKIFHTGDVLLSRRLRHN